MEDNIAGCEVIEKQKPLKKQLSRLYKTPPVDIEFQDVVYTVRQGKIRGEQKQILKSLSGKFSAGKLTAILGSSGSGKTSLLNILAGYVLNGVTGSIKINGRLRQMKMFNKLSAYIMQEDLLPAFLTVEEIMLIAAKLKLGDDVSIQEKQLVVREVTNILGLQNCLTTRTEDISGGQRKRLSIALELVNNPPVIFLDEPTTGLDTFAIKQCIETLQLLTGQGRTVICTIHQPSDAIFQHFNHVYFIADGMCVYNGTTANMIPFLSSAGVPCPTTYNPADYVIELTQLNEEYTSALVASTQNGRISRRDSIADTSKRPLLVNLAHDIYEDTTEEKLNMDFPTSFWTQFFILFSRMMLQLSRNKLVIALQIFSHTLSGFLLGMLFFGVGNSAAQSFANFKFCVSVIVFFLYTYLMTPVLLFPSEVKILKREYFNRWYGLKPYFLALTLQNLPLLTILGMSFMVITYLMTNQPLEWDRFMLFVFVGIFVAITTEGLGLIIGSIWNIKNGCVVAPSVAAPCLILCVHGMGYGAAIHPVMKVVMSTSYLRYALVAICQAVYGNRGPFECTEEDLYCHYKEPKHLLRDLGMLDSSYTFNMISLGIFLILFRIMAFFAIRYRLTYEFSNRIVDYANKILKQN